MMKTLLLATAAVTVLAVAAPASARVRHHYYGPAYGAVGEGVTGGGYDLSGPGGTDPTLGYRSYGYVRHHSYGGTRGGARAAYGYVPYNYGSYCGQLPKAC